MIKIQWAEKGWEGSADGKTGWNTWEFQEGTTTEEIKEELALSIGEPVEKIVIFGVEENAKVSSFPVEAYWEAEENFEKALKGQSLGYHVETEALEPWK